MQKEAKEGVKDSEVYHPSHYLTGKIETIDVIDACLSREEFLGYLKGNVIKYLAREQHKGGLTDLKKAGWYIDKILEGLSWDEPKEVKVK